MKETPIIFSAPIIKAIFDDRCTMTRRTWGLEEINRAPDTWEYVWDSLCQQHRFYDKYYKDAPPIIVKCPYGQVGDLLIIKETWATENRYNHLKPSDIPRTAKIYYLADGDYDPFEMGKVRSAMFMCHWMSRATAEITELRAERLQEITEEDAIREGFLPYQRETWWQGYRELNLGELGKELMHQQAIGNEPPDWMIEPHKMLDRPDIEAIFSAQNRFRTLWDSLNAKRGYGWETNPWVWVISFKVVK